MNYRFVLLENDEFFYTVYIQGKLLQLNDSQKLFLYSPKSKLRYCWVEGQQHQLWETWFRLTDIKGRLKKKNIRQVASARCFQMPCREASQSCLAGTHRGTSKDSRHPQSASVLQMLEGEDPGRVRQPISHSFFHFYSPMCLLMTGSERQASVDPRKPLKEIWMAQDAL